MPRTIPTVDEPTAPSRHAGGSEGEPRLPRETLRRVLNVAGLLVLLAIVVPFVVFAVPQLVGADYGFVVLSGSMEPAISTGDVVIVERVPATAIAVGDVITYERGANAVPTTHRVMEVTAVDGTRSFVTKGDANEDIDPGVVSAPSVLGRVAFTIPLIGYVVQFANSTVGLVALLLVPIGLLVVTEAWSFVANRRAAGREATREPARTDEPVDAATDARPANGATAAEASEETTVSVGANDLLLTTVALTAFTVYSSWIAFSDLTVVSVTIAVGALVTLLFLIGLQLSTPDASAAESSEERTEDVDASD